MSPQPTALLQERLIPLRDLHHEVLTRTIPDWLGNASTPRRLALKNIAPAWPSHASAEHDATLKPLIRQAWITQNQLDSAMEKLQSPSDFAAPLLQQALKQRFGVERDVRTTYLRLYVPATITWFAVRAGAARAWTVSLLDAALHNFEASETDDDAYEPHSTFITRPTASGHFETLPGVGTRISVADFTRLCRELDLGGQYSAYLERYLDLDNPVAKARLRQHFDASQTASLKVAMHMARIQGDLSEANFQRLQHLLNDPVDCYPLHCHSLSIMNSTLTGIVLFTAADLERARHTVPVIAYIPDDPQHPLKEYGSSVLFMQALTANLRQPAYQQFFSRFVNHDERGVFFADLGQRLANVTWHPHTRGDPRPSWRETPVDNPRLQFSVIPVRGSVLVHLFETKVSKLFNDARTQAVSTASADQKTRWERWSLFEKIGSALLQIAAMIAAPFVPPLGLLMLGYSAYQLLDDAFEGIIDWAEGLKLQAKEHLLAVAEQMIQLGLFVVGVPIAQGLLRKHLPAEIWQFFDRLTPVALPDGQARLWQPDLAPYARDVTLANGLRANALGLHPLGEEEILPLSGKHYAVTTDPATETHYLKHPTRPKAYRPKVTGNGQGTWVSELDHPLSWDSATLMRRLGHQVDGFTDVQLEQIRQVSGIDDSTLRKLYVNHETLPPLLADSLKRFRIDQNLNDLIHQLNSDDPAVQALADPHTQLLLLTNYGLWPRSKTLRLIDNSGRTRWEIPGSNGSAVSQIHESQLHNGDLLKTVLEALDEPQRKAMLEEKFGQPVTSLLARTRVLRKKLGKLAQDKRWALFDSMYRGVERTNDTQLTTLIDASPGLPVSAAEALRAVATPSELRAIDQGRAPRRLIELASETLKEVRTSRAYEGLYLDSVDNPDTDRLALHTLPDLPNWPAGLRIEVRNETIDGTLRDAIGNPTAATRRTLVYTTDGHYVPTDNGALFGETDFYTAILQAVPDPVRDALGIHIAQGPTLRQAIARHALHRAHLRPLLGVLPTGKLAYDPATMSLRGGMQGYRPAVPGPHRAPTPHEQTQQLFPALPPAHINNIVRSLENTEGGIATALTFLRNEYRQLDLDLRAWVTATPRLATDSEVRIGRQEFAYAKRNRQLWSDELRRAWRLETPLDTYFEHPTRNGHQLHLRVPISGNPPVLAARFSHISYLSLEGENGPLEIDEFLSHFPLLRHLNVRNIALGTLPPRLASMPRLNELVLSDCNITLTAQSQAALSNMNELVALDLFNNPLGRVPSVENMPGMHFLDLSSTGITELPAGVLQREHLETAVFRDNLIHTLPAELFELPAHTSHAFDLSGNPLSGPTLEQIKTYFQRTGSYWEASAAPVDVASTKALFPRFSNDDINRFVFGLPGNLERGRIELARLAQEYEHLGTELDDWADTEGLDESESNRRQAFKQELLAGWRREIKEDDYSSGHPPTYELDIHSPISGELPTLSARLNHVSTLNLRGDQSPLQLARLLESFPTLQALGIEHYSLGEIPESIFRLPTVKSLSLDHCDLRFSARAITALEGMTQLEQLNLSDNPLAQLPNFEAMTALTRIRLQNTGLGEIPASLLGNRERDLIDLSHNRITEIPSALLQHPASVTKAFDLSANPLSRTSLQALKRYCQRTGEHLRADALDADNARIAALYPTFINSEVNRFIFGLPGDLEAIPTEISRLENEYATLSADLTSWALNVPERHAVLDIPLDEHTRAEEQLARSAIKQQLEEGWRRETEIDELNGGEEVTHKLVLNTPILGELPTLSTRFEHVSMLELKGEETTTNVQGLVRAFPKLRTLLVEKYTLGDIPEVVFNLPRLTSLSLTQCSIRLSAEAAANLRDMRNLIYLDLSDNDLGRAPALDNMPKLEGLYLENCGLGELPAGVFTRPVLSTVDLSDNLISDIPDDILHMPSEWDAESDLSGNPLSEESLDNLRQYFRQSHNDLGVDQAAVDAEGRPVTPPPTPESTED